MKKILFSFIVAGFASSVMACEDPPECKPFGCARRGDAGTSDGGIDIEYCFFGCRLKNSEDDEAYYQCISEECYK